MRIRQLTVALAAGAAALSLGACGSTPSPAAGPVSAASQLRSRPAAPSRAITAAPATRSSVASSATGTVLTTVTVTESNTVRGSNTADGTVNSTTSTTSASSTSTPGQVTAPRNEPNAPGTHTTQSDPTLKVLPGSATPGEGGAPTGKPITTSTTMFQPENNRRIDPISTAAAFISLYADREADDSQAQNFSKRVTGFVTPQVQAQVDTESLTQSPPEYGRTIGIITAATIMSRPKPTATTASVFVIYTSRTAMKQQLVGQAAGIGKFVAVTKQKDGTWLVSGLKDAAN